MSATATDGSAAPTGSDVVYTGFGAGGGSSASNTGSASASQAAATTGTSFNSAAARVIVLNAGEMYGLAAVGAGIFAGFTFFL